MRKLILLSMVLALLLGTALVTAQDYSGVDPSGQTVVYWHQWDEAQLEALEGIINDFNANNEWGITVESNPMGTSSDVFNAVSAGVVAGDLPNISTGFLNDAMGWFLDGAVADLNPLMYAPVYGFSEEELADLNLGLININQAFGEGFDGQLLGIPVGPSANVMSVNLDMMAEVGLDGPPTSLEEFREAACAAAELTNPDGEPVNGYPIRTSGFDIFTWIAAQGGDVWDGEQWDFTGDEVIRVLTFQRDLYNDGCAYFPEGDSFQNTFDFAYGLNPFAQGSTAGTPFINGDIEDSGVPKNWVNVSVPYAEHPTIQIFGRSNIIYRATPEAELASWLFLKFWAQPENQIRWTEITRYQPFSFSAQAGLSQEFKNANPQFESLNALLLEPGTVVYAAPQVMSLNDAAGLLGELAAAIITGGEDPMEAAARFTDEANELLEDM